MPIFGTLRSLLRMAHIANQPGAPSASELPEIRAACRQTRRQLLQGALAGAAGCSLASWAKAEPPQRVRNEGIAPRVVIVGGGIAGLCAAYRLKKDGILAQVFEASPRTGGRIYTKTGLMGPGLTTELGGEFIDSDHKTMSALAREFGLELLDLNTDTVQREALFFSGSHHTHTQAIEAFRPLVARIEVDAGDLDDEVTFDSDEQTIKLDRYSLAQYLDHIDASGWIRKLIEVAYVVEYGLDVGELSALNLLTMISTNTSGGRLEIYGESDERYKIRGGNQQVIDALAWQLDGQVELGHRLVALKTKGEEFELHFAAGETRTVEVAADFVVLAMPFSVLRQVELNVELPKRKRLAIHELGYGTNTKLFAGVHNRVWREQGYSGSVFSDESFQTAFDNSRLQSGASGGLTLFTGGRTGVESGNGTAEDQVARLLVGMEHVFPGTQAALSGRVGRFHWPSYPFAQGSYACYKPGQYTTIAGAEGSPVGNLFFAGEHCSLGSSGYMEGGASSGLHAGRAVASRIRRRH